MIHYITPTGIASAWVANELRIVGEAGIPFRLHSMRASNQQFFASEWARRLDAGTNLIYPLSPVGVAVSLLLGPLLFGGRFFAALWNALTGEREHFRARVAGLAHFVAACHWARGLRNQPVSHIHSQWIHSGGTVGMYGAWLLGASFSFTGHAADLFRDRAALRDKIRRAKFIICISEFHRRFFLEEGARPEQLHVAYCGIDVEQMAPRREPRPDGAPFTILSSGRLVEKKGFDRLIDACGILRQRGREFRCVIAGDGPLLESLQQRIEQQGLQSLVEMAGKPLKQEDIPAFMHNGDLYALACVWAPDCDVDGLPQMLMEAMACGLPAVSTDLVGIPDLIEDGRTGLLVPAEDVEALAGALERLMDGAGLRQRLAAAGRQRVLEAFDIQTSLEPLLRLFRERLETGGAAGVATEPARVEAVS
jgi:colanic acid/amylovoran biosynthesis glycosyltransferase